ncbi:glycolipid 2-alpha-mannosyltransferase 1 [Podospora australis]|uniref:Glycolipid 2-alpha-mannosyltransferase 1 n=1 Tax=Podospora australis TaxID=1536484 RepID=A0AAN7AHD3_9PEZI|nr:glycolipid 2-alpha-mannosyltransferase 1 [Podospora australis]
MKTLLSAVLRLPFRLLRRPGPLPHRLSFTLKLSCLIALLCVLESFIRWNTYSIPRPPPRKDLDTPFATQCLDPTLSAASHPRESAALVMLARNSELVSALETIRNIEEKFNQWFQYPIIFLNNEPFSSEFKSSLSAAVSGPTFFETIPAADWGFPSHISPSAARKSIKQQGERKDKVWNGGKESYHHMCRFYSGPFYHQEVLKKYKWYWRLEPGVKFTCAVTYDPFVQMASHNKSYGYTIALWEEPNTCPNLFRTVDTFRTEQHIPRSPQWNALIDPELSVPAPVRWVKGLLGKGHHAENGDRWNLCHYWSNFEIADLDFFRGKPYQDLFTHLDKQGGFYFERWGDAPVHSLAVHLLLEKEKLHHFSDMGYHHEPFFQCPGNAPGGQLPENKALGRMTGRESRESEGAIGCRCECIDQRRRNNRGICLERMQRPQAWHRPSWWERYRGRYPYTINIW